jgi:hypothetical protein
LVILFAIVAHKGQSGPPVPGCIEFFYRFVSWDKRSVFE